MRAYRTRISFWLTVETAQRMEARAAELDLSVSTLCRVSVLEMMKVEGQLFKDLVVAQIVEEPSGVLPGVGGHFGDRGNGRVGR
jgi:hypothetical protein